MQYVVTIGTATSS